LAKFRKKAGEKETPTLLALQNQYITDLLKVWMIAIGKLIEKLTPLIIGSAPVISAIRKLVSESRMDSDEARMVNLEKAMELQSALNEKIDVQLKIVQALLANVQRTLRVLIIAVVGAVIFAISALVVSLLR
jgi:hypothetical protein